MRVAIQGGQASFHELAAKEYYSELPNFMYCLTFKDVFEALLKGLVDRGFIALSNSSHGHIKETGDLLMQYPTAIEGLHPYNVRQHLVGIVGSEINGIRKVLSHPVALTQCRLHLKDYGLENYHNTTAAMQYVKSKGDPSYAAVGGEEAARLYGMKVLRRDIQDNTNNITTFASIKTRQ